jgi:hypothetical protein
MDISEGIESSANTYCIGSAACKMQLPIFQIKSNQIKSNHQTNPNQFQNLANLRIIVYNKLDK